VHRIRISVPLGLLVFAASATSCTPSNHENDTNAQVAPAQAAMRDPTAMTGARTADDMERHWVQTEPLRNLMTELSTKTARNWPKDVPSDPEERQMRNVCNVMESATKLADGLATAAAGIPLSAREADMSEADRAGFHAEANTLRYQAMELGLAARAKKVEQMQRSLEAISVTCVSCHSRYRDFSGEFNLERVAAKSH
jgi:hypothetical protein